MWKTLQHPIINYCNNRLLFSRLKNHIVTIQGEEMLKLARSTWDRGEKSVRVEIRTWSVIETARLIHDFSSARQWFIPELRCRGAITWKWNDRQKETRVFSTRIERTRIRVVQRVALSAKKSKGLATRVGSAIYLNRSHAQASVDARRGRERDKDREKKRRERDSRE